jgi:hypothetical protein
LIVICCKDLTTGAAADALNRYSNTTGLDMAEYSNSRTNSIASAVLLGLGLDFITLKRVKKS